MKEKFPDSKMKGQYLSETLDGGGRESNNKRWGKRSAENSKFNHELLWRGRKGNGMLKNPRTNGRKLQLYEDPIASHLQCQESLSKNMVAPYKELYSL